MTQSYRFDRFEIRPSERLLLIDGEPAAVGARAFDLLVALLERRTRVVSKTELLDVVWPGLVVEESNLAAQVSALRKLLGQQSLATVPGRGYRFVAPAVEDEARASAEPTVARGNGGPAELPVLFGRDQDLSQLGELVERHRLVTILGPGGVGKTSLAHVVSRRAAGNLADGAIWIDLGEVRDVQAFPAALGRALTITIGSGADSVSSLVEFIRGRQALLVVDNAEHLLETVANFARAVLARASAVRMLVTSQAPLHVSNERLFRLQPLALPRLADTVVDAMACGSVALFADHARASDQSFSVSKDNVSDIARICTALDGLPLAIELAASRVRLLGLRELARRLDDRVLLLRNNSRDAPARHQTLLSTLEWGHSLLGPDEQRLLRRLGVFAASFSLDAVSAVAADSSIDHWAVLDSLSDLIDRSFVRMQPGPHPRYSLLGPVRDFARMRLRESDEEEQIQARHAAACAQLAESSYESYWPQPDAAWLENASPDLDNLRVALDWCLENDPGLGMRIAASSSVLFMLTGQAAECRRWLARLEPKPGAMVETGTDKTAARYFLERSRLSWGVQRSSMLEFARAAQAGYRALGDARGLYLALRCVVGSGISADEASQVLADMEAIEDASWPPRIRTQRLLAQMQQMQQDGRLQEAHEAGARALSLAEAGGLASVAAAALVGLAQVVMSMGQPAEAITFALRLLADPVARRGNFALHAWIIAVEAHLALGQVQEASQAVAEYIALSGVRDWEWFGAHAYALAAFAAARERFEEAARLIGHADAVGAPASRRDPQRAMLRSDALGLVAARIGAAEVAALLAEGRALREPEVCAFLSQ